MENRMKAYVVRSKDDDQGSVLIFAENVNMAKLFCYNDGKLDADKYIDLSAKREKDADKYFGISIGHELKWEDDEHRKILIEEFGWREI
jgi:hypothetical protein